MQVKAQGIGPVFMSPDPDEARTEFAQKSRVMTDKRMSEREAVARFIPDDTYLAFGGFGTNRIPTAVIHELLRARRKGLGFLGHTSTHDFELLCASECIDRVDAAYIVGLEARGLDLLADALKDCAELARMLPLHELYDVADVIAVYVEVPLRPGQRQAACGVRGEVAQVPALDEVAEARDPRVFLTKPQLVRESHR
jgi:hypothetical protein